MPCHTDKQRSLEYCQMDSFILLCGQIFFHAEILLCMFWAQISFSLVDVTKCLSNENGHFSPMTGDTQEGSFL